MKEDLFRNKFTKLIRAEPGWFMVGMCDDGEDRPMVEERIPIIAWVIDYSCLGYIVTTPVTVNQEGEVTHGYKIVDPQGRDAYMD